MYLRALRYGRTVGSMDAVERLAAWVREQPTRDDAAKALDFSREMLDALLYRKRLPGRLNANAIERVTSLWTRGPIRSEEWDEIERAERAKKAAGEAV